ncbi:MAG TPA: FAD-dependent oxidoreductase [Burkholderiales bacterium]
MNRRKLLLLAAIAALVAAFFYFDARQYLSLESLKAQRAALETWFHAHPAQAVLAYFAAYVVMAALSFPGATLVTLAGGAIFGLLWGTVIVSFASTVGATLAMLASRFLFRDAMQEKFGENLKAMNEGIARDGAFYLFTLRLIPLFPFWLINLVMGLTPIRAATFFWVSQVGMLPGTIVYVYAGTELAQIQSLSGILSPGIIFAFTLLGLFPLIARKLVDWVKARRVYAGWQRPARFDRNLVVIGAGSAGLVSAYIAAAVKARVTLIERHRMGGDCLNTGCVPSKALLRSAKFLSQIKRCREFGIARADAQFDFADVMERVQRVVRTVEPHDSVERYTRLGVECLQGEATITSPWTVEVKTAAGTQTLATRSIVIAAGARPFVPPIPGIDKTGYLTSDNLWELRELPRRLVVLGGGPIGCELAQAFSRFGSEVTQVEMLPRLLAREDPEASELVEARVRAEGIRVLTAHTAREFLSRGGASVLVAEQAGERREIEFDRVLVAVGRVANTAGYGLEKLGIAISGSRTVECDEFLRTKYPNIYACGDVAGPYQFTHIAAHQAWYAAVNALFGRFRKFRADYRVTPWATFVEPEVARVGLTELEARTKGIPCEVTRYGLDDLDRAIADGEPHGFVKVLTVPGKDRILGVTIVGEHAADLMAEFVLAMKQGIGLNRILGTIHVYPTLAEANKYAAGQWKRAHAPQKLLAWVERYHSWQLG